MWAGADNEVLGSMPLHQESAQLVGLVAVVCRQVVGRQGGESVALRSCLTAASAGLVTAALLSFFLQIGCALCVQALPLVWHRCFKAARAGLGASWLQVALISR